MTITRTIALNDIEPAELAELFCEMDSEKQADFFRMVGFIAKSWPGAGWCQQSCDIARHLEVTGRETITKLAEHVLCYDECLQVLSQYESDLLFPPQGDSRERRLARVRDVIARSTFSPAGPLTPAQASDASPASNNPASSIEASAAGQPITGAE